MLVFSFLNFIDEIIRPKYEERPKKSTINNLYFEVTDFNDFTIFKEKFFSYNLPTNNYTVYVKVRYDVDNFFMAGNQFGFRYDDESHLYDLYLNIIQRLEQYYSSYNLSDSDIVYIQVSFRSLYWQAKSDLSIDKIKTLSLSTQDKKRTLDIITIPISTKPNYLPKPLDTTFDNNNQINRVILTIDNKSFNFMDLIIEKTQLIRNNHKDIITSFDKNTKFYFMMDKINYILAIRKLNKHTTEKLKYSTSGVLLSRVTDNKIDDNSVIRTRDNETIQIKDNKVVSSTTPITFKPLDVVKIKDNNWLPNTNIGVIDTETYFNGTKHEIYALGYKTILEKDNNPITFYIDKDCNSDKLILSFIDEIMRPKYENITFYCHNLAGYDVIFIVSVINKFNENADIDNQYQLEPLLRDSKIIKLTIKKGKRKVTLTDSLCILTSSLAMKIFLINIS